MISPDHNDRVVIQLQLFERIQYPANLRIDYRPLPELLRTSRWLATLSSTAFFDALDFGCNPLVMADLGLQSRYGGHVFAGSGVWRC